MNSGQHRLRFRVGVKERRRVIGRDVGGKNMQGGVVGDARVGDWGSRTTGLLFIKC